MLQKGFVGRGVYPHKALLRTSSKLPRRPARRGKKSLIALHSVRSIDSNWKNNKKHTTPGAASSENDRVLFGKRAKRGKKLKFLSANTASEIYLCHCNSSLKNNYSVPSSCHSAAIITGKRAWVTYPASIIK